MIISGGSRNGARWFSGHFMRTDQGQKVTLLEARGLAGDSIPYWFAQMEALALGTRCTNYFYHANINPREDEELTPAQRDRAIDTLERNLGLEGHSRFVVQHEKFGRTHWHVCWSRIDPDTMRAVSDSKTYRIHERTADELEQAFGYAPTPRAHEREHRNPDNYEVFRGKRSGIDPYALGQLLTQLWNRADSGPAFAASLNEHGFVLARGDRRSYVVVDAAGDAHSLAKRIAGARTKDVKERLAEVDLASLPSVAEARALARDRAAKEEDRVQQTEPAPAPARAPDRRSAFDVIAEKVMEAIGEFIESRGQEGTRDESTAPREFDPLAREATTIAEEAAPALTELSTFERFAEESTEACRAAGGALLITEGLEWLARKIGWRSPDVPAADTRQPSAFDRFTRDATQAARENGGEPEAGFWARGIAALSAARDRALAFARTSARTFAGRLLRDRNTDHNKGLER